VGEWGSVYVGKGGEISNAAQEHLQPIIIDCPTIASSGKVYTCFSSGTGFMLLEVGGIMQIYSSPSTGSVAIIIAK
jgi:hypothetical protein